MNSTTAHNLSTERLSYRFGVRTRLLILILLVTVPLLIGVTAYISNRAGNEIETQALRALQKNNQSLATNVSTWLELHVRTTKEIALLPDIASMDAARQKPVLQAVASTHPNLFLVHTTGLNGINVSRNDDAVPNDYSDRAWYLGAKEGASITFEALISRTIGKPALNMAAPIYDDSGRIVGVVSIVSELSEISKEVLDFEEGRGITYIVDANNRVVAHPDPTYTENELRDLSTYPPIAALSEGKIGEITFTDENGVDWVAYVDKLDNGWGIVAQQHEAELLAPVRQFQTTATILIILGSLTMLALASFFVQRSLRPIATLTEAASAISAGDFDRLAVVDSEDEFGLLASTFNSMTARLRESIVSLEQRVADRTKALATSSDVSRRLSTILDKPTLAREVVEQVQSSFNYYHAHIYFFDDENENLVMAGGTGEAGAAMLASGHRIPRGRGLVGRAAETNEPVLVSDVSQSIGWLPNPLLPDTLSEAAVPISIGNKVLGVLDVQHNVVNGLDENDIALLQSLSGQVAISLQNAISFEQSRSKAEMEALVNVIGQKIQRTASMEEALQTAIREVGLALGATSVRASIGLDTSPTDQASQN